VLLFRTDFLTAWFWIGVNQSVCSSLIRPRHHVVAAP